MKVTFPDFNDYVEAAYANQKEDHFNQMRAVLLPFWIENGKTMGMDFDTLCERLDIKRPRTSQSESHRKAKASKAIERAEAIKRSDSKRNVQ